MFIGKGVRKQTLWLQEKKKLIMLFLNKIHFLYGRVHSLIPFIRGEIYVIYPLLQILKPFLK